MHKLRILIAYPDPAGLAPPTSMSESSGHHIEEAAADRAAVRLMGRQGTDPVRAGAGPADGDAPAIHPGRQDHARNRRGSR